jgi:hypothetical protein
MRKDTYFSISMGVLTFYYLEQVKGRDAVRMEEGEFWSYKRDKINAYLL